MVSPVMMLNNARKEYEWKHMAPVSTATNIIPVNARIIKFFNVVLFFIDLSGCKYS